MNHQPAASRLCARTEALTELPDLTSILPDDACLAWIRNGDGLIGFGEFARLETEDFGAAERWWFEFAARIDHDCDLSEGFGVGPLAFASFVFDPNNTAQRSVMIVPEVIVGRRNGRAWLTVLAEAGSPYPTVPDAAQQPPTPPSEAEVIGDSLTRDRWMGIVQESVNRISAGRASKVVLARAEELRTASPLDARWLITELSARYPTCWTYHVEGLVGSSPEMLVRCQAGLATSRVLAGTIRREGTEELDLKLARSLARSGKNLIEHQLAVASVAEALEPFCSGMNVPDAPYVLELPNVLHLASDVTAVARPGISALRLAGELHPSAAVCGTPQQVARDVITALEELDRGRYSGPVGWLDADGDGEFAIALRCGQLDAADPHRITIYAGCGIVEESDPFEEYAETQAKLMPMRQALGRAAVEPVPSV